MAFLKKLLGQQPVNREDMLSRAESEIEMGRYQRAANIGVDYKNSIIKSQSLPSKQKYLDAAYAWYIVVKASYRMIESDREYQKYEFFKGFFAAHRMAMSCFQEITFSPEKFEWDKTTEHYPYYAVVSECYESMYERFGSNEELEEADFDANDEISGL